MRVWEVVINAGFPSVTVYLAVARSASDVEAPATAAFKQNNSMAYIDNISIKAVHGSYLGVIKDA